MISIVDYGMGNLRSIQNALTYIGVDSRITGSPDEILKSEKLILPGVGSFRVAMENLKRKGLLPALNKAVLEQKIPVLGICLGMQLLAEQGEEDGPTKGLGWIPGEVKHFPKKDKIKVPHIGFNTVSFKSEDILFSGLNNCADFYFVHSYHMICRDPYNVSSWSKYGEEFVAGVHHENIFGTQFHPEKSQSNGLRVLKNFANLDNQNV